jgi:hypothetical protein
MTEPRTVQVYTKDFSQDDRDFTPRIVREGEKPNPKGVGVASSSPVTNEPSETPEPVLQEQLDFQETQETHPQTPEAEHFPQQNPSAPVPGESLPAPDSSQSPTPPKPLTFPPSQPSAPQPVDPASQTGAEPAAE